MWPDVRQHIAERFPSLIKQIERVVSNHVENNGQAQTIAAQADEIERLKSEILSAKTEGMNTERSANWMRADQREREQAAEIERLRAALEFYANPDTYQQLVEKEPYGETWIDTPKGSPLEIEDVDELGAGVMAREALQPQEAENV